MTPENNQQRFARIPAATFRSGISRSKLYELAAKHPGLFRKLDSMTLVDMDKLDQVLAALPVAEIA